MWPFPRREKLEGRICRVDHGFVGQRTEQTPGATAREFLAVPGLAQTFCVTGEEVQRGEGSVTETVPGTEPQGWGE